MTNKTCTCKQPTYHEDSCALNTEKSNKFHDFCIEHHCCNCECPPHQDTSKEKPCRYCHTTPCQIEYKHDTSKTKLPQWEEVVSILSKIADVAALNKGQLSSSFLETCESKLMKAIEQAYDEGYAVRGGVESEQKQRMYDAGVTVGKKQREEELKEQLSLQAMELKRAWEHGQCAELEAMIVEVEGMKIKHEKHPDGKTWCGYCGNNKSISDLLTALKARKETLK